MRTSTKILMAGAAALALAACGAKEDAKEAKTGEAAEAAADVGPAGTPTNPKQKAGLWEQTMTVDGAPAMAMKLCIDEAMAAKGANMSAQMRQDQCSENKMSRGLDGGWSFSSTCNLGSGGTVQSKGKATGDLSSNYHMEATTVTTGAAVPQMNRTGKMTMDAKWLGPCPAGMGPGAIEVGGMTIDPSMMKGMQGAPK